MSSRSIKSMAITLGLIALVIYIGYMLWIAYLL
jgi:uncharacterized membrane protein (DUF485 family)